MANDDARTGVEEKIDSWLRGLVQSTCCLFGNFGSSSAQSCGSRSRAVAECQNTVEHRLRNEWEANICGILLRRMEKGFLDSGLFFHRYALPVDSLSDELSEKQYFPVRRIHICCCDFQLVG